jgi:hypothetical protein
MTPQQLRTEGFFQMVRENVIVNTPFEFTLILKDEFGRISGKYTLKRTPAGSYDAQASDSLGPGGTERVLVAETAVTSLPLLLKRNPQILRALAIAKTAGVPLKLIGIEPQMLKLS